MRLSVRWFVIFMAFMAAPVSGAEYRGIVDEVLDGDAFVLCEAGQCQRIRLCGMDAPEGGQVGFELAAEALRVLVEGKEVVCTQVGDGTICDGRANPTSNNRVVAQCFLDREDIGAIMVRDGYACDRTSQSNGHYSSDGVGIACPKRP